MKILIVDDDVRRRGTLVEHLLKQHVVSRDDVTEVGCADDAKKALSSLYFDVLILDVVLPKRVNETADPRHGIALLGQLSRSAKLLKPEKIIGITAYSKDIPSFRREFEKHCLAVIEADPVSSSWRARLVQSLSYTESSKLGRVVTSNNIHGLTIHGIRTFGAWQNRLKTLVHRKVRDVPFHSYKYGYFATATFFIPLFRAREVRRLVTHLRELFKDNPGSEFVVFSHSFGTYLMANALHILSREIALPIKTFVLSGSVLRRGHDWTEIQRAGVRVVNDCADSDYVLWISEMLIFGTGMAGKCGFYGFQNEKLVNRYFRGGHSSYFEGDEFMEDYWIPLFDANAPVAEVDCRRPSTLMHEVCDKIVGAIGYCKNAFYFTILRIFGHA